MLQDIAVEAEVVIPVVLALKMTEVLVEVDQQYWVEVVELDTELLVMEVRVAVVTVDLGRSLEMVEATVSLNLWAVVAVVHMVTLPLLPYF